MDGVVVLAGRGALPFATLHGRPLYLHAAEALAGLGLAPTLLVDDGPGQRPAVDDVLLPPGTRVRSLVEWWADRPAGPVLLHDPLCPLTPASLLRTALDHARDEPSGDAGALVSLAAYRPVTDTVKTVVGDRIEGTLDRDGLGIVTAPVVLDRAVLDGAGSPPPVADFGALVAWARARTAVRLVRAPLIGRRVEDEASVHLLECVDEMSHQLRHPSA